MTAAEIDAVDVALAAEPYPVRATTLWHDSTLNARVHLLSLLDPTRRTLHAHRHTAAGPAVVEELETLQEKFDQWQQWLTARPTSPRTPLGAVPPWYREEDPTQ